MTFAPLIVLAVWMGLYPAPFLRRLETSVQHIVTRVGNPQYAAECIAADCADAGAGRGGRAPTTRRPDSWRRCPADRRKPLAAPASSGTGADIPAPAGAGQGGSSMPAGISASDFYYILPELVLTAGALLVLIADVLLPRAQRRMLAWVTLAALGATAVSLVPFAHDARRGRARPAGGRSVRAVLQGPVSRRGGVHRC